LRNGKLVTFQVYFDKKRGLHQCFGSISRRAEKTQKKKKKPWIRIRNSIKPKMLDPDPESINLNRKHWITSINKVPINIQWSLLLLSRASYKPELKVHGGGEGRVRVVPHFTGRWPRLHHHQQPQKWTSICRGRGGGAHRTRKRGNL
jgi:hypothetical protein